MSITSVNGSEIQTDRYEALLRMGKAVAVCSDCETAKAALVNELREITRCDYLHLVAFEKTTNKVSWQILEARDKREDLKPVPGDTPTTWVDEFQQLLAVPDWERETRFPEYAELLRELGIASTCTLPLARGQRRLGAVTFGSSIPQSYPEDETGFLVLV